MPAVVEVEGGRCFFCGGAAALKLRYARVTLCREHFLQHVARRVRRAMEASGLLKPGSLVVVGLSGGKDSASLAHILATEGNVLGLKVVGFHVVVDEGEYFSLSEQAVRRLAELLGLDLVLLNLKEVLGVGLRELTAVSNRPPCSVCGIVKRYAINAAGVELKASAVVFAHNLDDILRLMVKNLVTGNAEQLAKLLPLVPTGPGLVPRLRPLYEVHEDELRLYVKLAGLPYVDRSCPFKHVGWIDTRASAFVEELEERSPGAKLTMIRVLRRLIESAGEGKVVKASACSVCGLAAGSDPCSFCRITRKATGAHGGPLVRGYLRSVTPRQSAP